MPTIQVYVDDQTLARLTRAAVRRGADASDEQQVASVVEDLASSAVSETALGDAKDWNEVDL